MTSKKEPEGSDFRTRLEQMTALARTGDRAAFEREIWADWETLHDYLTSFVLDNAGPEFVVPYVNDALPRFLRTLELLPFEKDLDILEFGANPWLFSILLERFFDYRLQFTNFTAATIFDQSVTRGSQRIRSERYGEDYEFSFTSFNLELVPPPFAEGSFDVVLFCEILEHLVIDPLAIFPRLYRLLKPGGLLVITTPNAVRLVNVAYLLAGSNFFDRYHPENGVYGRHNREFTVGELERLLPAAGFVECEVRTADRYDYDRIAIDKDNYEAPARLPYTRTTLLALLQSVGATTENRGDNLYVRARRPTDPAP
ncbi:MAG: class I SAM-dependent methyltransferase [Acidobacteriota bacterium]|nr:class I SAM-dependent methyltransferase [Acidobacteriota bacterium]